MEVLAYENKEPVKICSFMIGTNQLQEEIVSSESHKTVTQTMQTSLNRLHHFGSNNITIVILQVFITSLVAITCVREGFLGYLFYSTILLLFSF